MIMILHQLNSKEVVVNFNNVTEAYEHQNCENERFTEIEFINGEYVNVQESLGEIESKLGLECDDEEAEILAARKGEE